MIVKLATFNKEANAVTGPIKGLFNRASKKVSEVAGKAAKGEREASGWLNKKLHISEANAGNSKVIDYLKTHKLSKEKMKEYVEKHPKALGDHKVVQFLKNHSAGVAAGTVVAGGTAGILAAKKK